MPSASFIFRQFKTLAPRQRVEFFQELAADCVMPFAVRELAAQAAEAERGAALTRLGVKAPNIDNGHADMLAEKVATSVAKD